MAGQRNRWSEAKKKHRTAMEGLRLEDVYIEIEIAEMQLQINEEIAATFGGSINSFSSKKYIVVFGNVKFHSSVFGVDVTEYCTKGRPIISRETGSTAQNCTLFDRGIFTSIKVLINTVLLVTVFINSSGKAAGESAVLA